MYRYSLVAIGLMGVLALAACQDGGIQFGDGSDAADDTDTAETDETKPQDEDQDGYSTALETDCNDTDPAVHPGAEEVCDGIDNDCDSEVDEGLPTLEYYVDKDSDGYGAGELVELCTEPESGYSSVAGDCDDADAAVYPGAEDAPGDGRDQDCDDEPLVEEVPDSDQDGDGYNAAPETDCDDEDPDVHPGAEEVCDGIDNDCDGSTDEGCPEEETFTLNVDYPSPHDRLELNVQMISDASKIGDGWDTSDLVYDDDDIEITLEDDFDDLLGILFNVPVSDDSDNDGDYDANDTYDWYCYGHYSTASLESGVEVDIVLDGVAYDEEDLVTWSPGSSSDTSLGCSALLWLDPTVTITEGHVQ